MMKNICKIHYAEEQAIQHLSNKLSEIITKDTVIFNIGTDKCIGDSFAPILGTLLNEKGIDIPVYGTLEKPIHALNIHEYIDVVKTVNSNSRIIAIDSALGHKNNIGKISIRNTPIKPGAGVGKKLPHIGDYSIVLTVEEIEASYRLNEIRLGFIMAAAKVVIKAIISSLDNKN